MANFLTLLLKHNNFLRSKVNFCVKLTLNFFKISYLSTFLWGKKVNFVFVFALLCLLFLRSSFFFITYEITARFYSFLEAKLRVFFFTRIFSFIFTEGCEVLFFRAFFGASGFYCKKENSK